MRWDVAGICGELRVAAICTLVTTAPHCAILRRFAADHDFGGDARGTSMTAVAVQSSTSDCSIGIPAASRPPSILQSLRPTPARNARRGTATGEPRIDQTLNVRLVVGRARLRQRIAVSEVRPRAGERARRAHLDSPARFSKCGSSRRTAPSTAPRRSCSATRFGEEMKWHHEKWTRLCGAANICDLHFRPTARTEHTTSRIPLVPCAQRSPPKPVTC